MPETNAPLMIANKLRKSYGEVEVLSGVDLEIRSGKVHALLGENGAGKSTLVKILSGFEPHSGGQLKLRTESGFENLEQWNNKIAEQVGVVLIHQEFNLAEQLSVVENIFLGSEIKKGLFLDKGQMKQLAAQYLKSLNSSISPDTTIADLSVSDKQMVEIAKARAKKTRLLILDEPTAVLTTKESQVLFKLITRLKAEGVAIVYISHKLEEIEEIADHITILRDGAMVGTYNAEDINKDDMARLMVGRELTQLFPTIPKPTNSAPMVLSVENLQVTNEIYDASFTLSKGEVLGFAGLVGSGRSALMQAIVGLKPIQNANAKISLNGEQIRFKNLKQARKQGLAYLSKDRKGQGLLLNMDLKLNFSLFSLHKFSNVLINEKTEQQAFDKAVETFDIRMKDASINAGSLSGGNQQKLLLAKIMEADPSLIIIDEPTRGIDIGTKSQIYHFIAKLAEVGHSVILISSDIMEVIGMSHRVAVMCRGNLAGILEDDAINEQEIMRYATGLASS